MQRKFDWFEGVMSDQYFEEQKNTTATCLKWSRTVIVGAVVRVYGTARIGVCGAL